MPSWRYDDEGDVVVDASSEGADEDDASSSGSEPEPEEMKIRSRSQTYLFQALCTQ